MAILVIKESRMAANTRIRRLISSMYTDSIALMRLCMDGTDLVSDDLLGLSVLLMGWEDSHSDIVLGELLWRGGGDHPPSALMLQGSSEEA